MLQTTAVIYCAIEPLVPARGRVQPGFDEFSAALEHAGIPLVWVSNRSRLELDEPRRRLDHRHPFIAEGGCGVYLPEGYFHLPLAKSVRLGRFTCIPVAEPQPAASEALEQLSQETGVAAVPLSSLSPRELTQNLNLPSREAELARHRDFDEPFFFAGSSNHDIDRFTAEAHERKLQLRQRGALWSLAVRASTKQCIRELVKLYERVLRSHPTAVAIATSQDSAELFPACDRSILLTEEDADASSEPRGARAGRQFSLSAPDMWEQILETVTTRRS